MILAEKITKLRKQQGWSQEELANQLNVTRQSVSKWESMASIPDLDKIIKMSRIFGVSTDYLLMDDAEESAEDTFSPDTITDPENQVRTVSLEEANDYLEQTARSSFKIALGVAVCITCPIPIILLAAASYQPGSMITEAMASGIGVSLLLLMVAAAVAVFITEGLRLHKYEYLEKSPIETEYGVAGVAELKRENYQPVWHRNIVAGVSCCILAVVPLIAASAFRNGNAFLMSGLVALMLAIIALGVFLIVHSSIIWNSFHILLEEGDYTRKNKKNERQNSPLCAIYWSIATAVYLGWSFITFDWERTWIMWPVAAVLYAAVEGIANVIRSRQTR